MYCDGAYGQVKSKHFIIYNKVTSPWLPEDIILCVPKVTAVPHKYLAESDPLLCGVKGHLLRTEATSCLSEGRVEVLGRVDLNGRAGLGEREECGRCKQPVKIEEKKELGINPGHSASATSVVTLSYNYWTITGTHDSLHR